MYLVFIWGYVLNERKYADTKTQAFDALKFTQDQTDYIRDSIDQSKTSFLVSSVSLSSFDVSSSIQWLLCCEVSECGNKY